MPSLTIRDIPEKVLEQLRDAARAQKRSVNAQAVYWLEQMGREWGSLEERTKLFERIRASREATFRKHGLGTDSAKLIRQMRDERTRTLLRRTGR